MIIFEELYTWNYAKGLAQLTRLSGIITKLQVQLRMTGSKYCGILTSNIQTGHVIQHRRTEIVVLYKTEKKCHPTELL